MWYEIVSKMSPGELFGLGVAAVWIAGVLFAWATSGYVWNARHPLLRDEYPDDWVWKTVGEIGEHRYGRAGFRTRERAIADAEAVLSGVTVSE